MESLPPFDAPRVAEHIVHWLKAYAQDSGMEGFVVGVSGGIDSAVTSTLCALTGMPTLCVDMPIHQGPDQVGRAANHVEWLCGRHPLVRRSTVSLTEVYDLFAVSLPDGPDASQGLAMANSRARLRMTTLYALAQRRRALVVGTGNKVEDFGVGFYTKYGDGGVDLSPIADLVKTEVFALGAHLGVGKDILDAPPMGCGATIELTKTNWAPPTLNWSGPCVGSNSLRRARKGFRGASNKCSRRTVVSTVRTNTR